MASEPKKILRDRSNKILQKFTNKNYKNWCRNKDAEKLMLTMPLLLKLIQIINVVHPNLSGY